MAPEPLTIAGQAVVILTALIFARAAASKLRDLTSFIGVVENYQILPAPLAPLVARLTPFLEGLLAALLVLTTTRSTAAMTSAGLLLLFGAAIAVNLLRGRSDIDCGCGDPGQRHPLRWTMVARNLALSGALAVGSATKTVDLSPWAWILGTAAGLAMFVLYLAHEALLMTPRGHASPDEVRSLVRTSAKEAQA